MSSQLSKFQPHRTIALRGFDALGASAALHSATANSFIVSGTFRDAADFAVLMLWDADNFYEHPRLRYLPDFNFKGANLTFDLLYTPGLQPIDSPKSNWIDWATFDYVPTIGQPGSLRLWDNCSLKSGDFTPASGTFHLQTNTAGIQPTDRLTIFFQNFSFDYQPAPGQTSIEYEFFATGTGNTHTITVNGRSYSHTEADPSGESSALQANSLVTLINAGSGDPDVTAAIGSQSYSVLLSTRSTPLSRSALPATALPRSALHRSVRPRRRSHKRSTTRIGGPLTQHTPCAPQPPGTLSRSPPHAMARFLPTEPPSASRPTPVLYLPVSCRVQRSLSRARFTTLPRLIARPH